MNRTLAATWIRSPYWWLLGLTVAGVIAAEILYFHALGMRGVIPAIFSIEEVVKQQGWWNDERKGVWICGALWGVGVAAKIVLKRV